MNEAELNNAINANTKAVDAASEYYYDLMRGGSYDLARVQKEYINGLLHKGDSIMNQLFKYKDEQ